MKHLPAALALALTLAVAPALVACSGNPIEQAIEGATGADVDLGSNSVPADYPVDAVPLIDGEVVHGGSVKADGNQVWNVTIRVADGAAYDTIKAQLEAAGLPTAEVGGVATENGGTGAFDNDDYGVLVVVSKDGDNGFIANYTVTTKN